MRKYRLITAVDSRFCGLGVIRGYIMEDDVWVEYSPEDLLEIIMEELEHYNPGFNEFYSLYFHGDYSGISLEIDYTPDNVSDESVERIREWLWKNVRCEYHSEIIRKQHHWYCERNTNKNIYWSKC
jgi:hypothetical protein